MMLDVPGLYHNSTDNANKDFQGNIEHAVDCIEGEGDGSDDRWASIWDDETWKLSIGYLARGNDRQREMDR